MFLSKEALSEFQSLYLKEFQITITETEALEYGTHLINLVKAVYGKDVKLNIVDNNDRKEQD